MKITEHFNLDEFDCKDGSMYPDEWVELRLKPLCEALEVIREAAGKPIHILSGYRTKAHNRQVRGKPKSQHLEGRAVDMIARGLPPRVLYAKIVDLIEKGKIPEGGLAVGPSFVHYDQRGSKARWNY